MSFDWGMLVRPLPAIILILPFAVFPGLGWHEEELNAEAEAESVEYVPDETETRLNPIFYPSFILKDYRLDNPSCLVNYPHLCFLNLIYWYGIAVLITLVIENLPEKISEVKNRRRSGSG